MAVKKVENNVHGTCCQTGHKYIIGIILVVVGLAIKYGMDFADILILVGAILLIKGILLRR